MKAYSLALMLVRFWALITIVTQLIRTDELITLLHSEPQVDRLVSGGIPFASLLAARLAIFLLAPLIATELQAGTIPGESFWAKSALRIFIRFIALTFLFNSILKLTLVLVVGSGSIAQRFATPILQHWSALAAPLLAILLYLFADQITRAFHRADQNMRPQVT